MNLYKISQNANNDYDTYDSAVVCAASEENAKCIHPGGEGYEVTNEEVRFDCWTTLNNIKVELIGEAAPNIKEGDVVCASFNAG